MDRQETIARHRRMWRWIADETAESATPITKEDYVSAHPDDPVNNCRSTCYACEYSILTNIDDDNPDIYDCRTCPLQWSDKPNTQDYPCLAGHDGELGPYGQWQKAVTEFYETPPTLKETREKHKTECGRLAREIAELPETDTTFDTEREMS